MKLAHPAVAGPMIIHETFDTETVVVNLDKGTYYSLTDSASEVWDLLGRASGDEIVSFMAARYGVDEGVVAGPVASFIDRLAHEQLVIEGPAVNGGLGQPEPSGQPFEPPSFETFDDMADLLLLDPIHDVDETGWPVAPAANPGA